MKEEGQKVMIYSDLNKKAEEYITRILQQGPTADYPYHNIYHTRKVVEYAEFLAEKENIPVTERQKIKFAAWFHDAGYSISYYNHEEYGIRLAKDFLEQKSISNGFVIPVEDMIRATIMPQKPETNLEMILCDADMYHLSEGNIIEQSLDLMEEWKMVTGRHITGHKYLRTTLNLMTSHRYFTTYGKQVLEEKKQNNLRKVMDYLNRNL